jgi:hypothetical protein
MSAQAMALAPSCGDYGDADEMQRLTENERLYRAAKASEDAFTQMLQQLYGKHANDYRYICELQLKWPASLVLINRQRVTAVQAYLAHCRAR